MQDDALAKCENIARAKLSILTVKTIYTRQLVSFYHCQFAHVADTKFRKLLVVILHHAFYRRVHLCFCHPCITFWVLYPKYLRFFFHALPCVALRLVSMAVASLLGHVPHSLEWKPGDDLTQLAFWENMTDIPQVEAIHPGIC